MFLIGLSGSFLPYILAFAFSWILLGNTSVTASETDSSTSTTLTISHEINTAVSLERCTHFYADAAIVSPSSVLLSQFVLPFDWEIPHQVFCPEPGFLLASNKRGPPQI